MSRGRAASLAVALLALTLILGACSTSSDGSTIAATDLQAANANRAAAARNRAILARRAISARRRALRARRRATSTTKPSLAFTPTSTTIATASQSSHDPLTAIQKTVDDLNNAFATSVSAGVVNSTVANHWVATGVYTGDECISFEMARGQGVVSEHLTVHPETLTASPGWVDPAIGGVAAGRIFELAIDETQTLVTTGQQRGRTLWIHVTVDSAGNARLFLRCR
jgi:hypothetical protein